MVGKKDPYTTVTAFQSFKREAVKNLIGKEGQTNLPLPLLENTYGSYHS